jgi:hypothetical protein
MIYGLIPLSESFLSTAEEIPSMKLAIPELTSCDASSKIIKIFF